MKQDEEVSPRPLPENFYRHSTERGAGCFELRMHGIGDHDYLSSLGSPELIKGRPLEPDTAGPPILPKHSLRLLAWSRMSRRHAKLLWFLALPFTLVNVAGYMGDKPRHILSARTLLMLAVSVAGIVLTISAYLWAVVLVEEITKALAVKDMISWIPKAVQCSWHDRFALAIRV